MGDLSLTMGKRKPPKRSAIGSKRIKAEELLQQALSLQSQGAFAEALALATQANELVPSNANSTFVIGMLQFQHFDHETGLAYLEKATTLEPSNAGFSANFGTALAESGRWNDAICYFEMALEYAATNETILRQYVEALSQTNRIDEALIECEKLTKLFPKNKSHRLKFAELLFAASKETEAIAALNQLSEPLPDDLEFANRIGLLLMNQGAFEDSKRIFTGVLEKASGNLNAGTNLAICFLKQGEFASAIGQFKNVTDEHPEKGIAFQNLGFALMTTGNYEEAVNALKQAVELESSNDRSQELLARALVSANEHEEAKRTVRKWLGISPSNSIARHVLASLGEDDTPERCSDEYVQSTFDDFSATYDSVLKKIQYRGPKLIADCLEQRFKAPERDTHVLDAGCGTGLCGPVVRPLSSHLVGVDLSAGMLEKAKTTHLYDALVESELVNYLVNHPATYDLVISGDTFNYFGELNPLFDAAVKSLIVGALLVFTLEIVDEQTDRFHLNPHGRYSHRSAYVLEELKNCGLVDVQFTPCILRYESETPVSGAIFSGYRADPGDSVGA